MHPKTKTLSRTIHLIVPNGISRLRTIHSRGPHLLPYRFRVVNFFWTWTFEKEHRFGKSKKWGSDSYKFHSVERRGSGIEPDSCCELSEDGSFFAFYKRQRSYVRVWNGFGEEPCTTEQKVEGQRLPWKSFYRPARNSHLSLPKRNKYYYSLPVPVWILEDQIGESSRSFGLLLLTPNTG